MKNIPDLEVSLSPVEQTKDGATLVLSKELCKYLGINKKIKDLYLVPTDGILQISTKPCIATIPIVTDDNLEFKEQDEAVDEADDDADLI